MRRLLKNLFVTFLLVGLTYFFIFVALLFNERRRVVRSSSFSIESFIVSQRHDFDAKTIDSTSQPLTASLAVVTSDDRISKKAAAVDQSLNELIASRTCTNLTRPRTDAIRRRHYHWQVLTGDSDTEVVVYTAFYDDRPIAGFPPWIRILGVAKVTFFDQNLFCHVWYAQSDIPYVVDAESIQTGRDHDIVGNQKYGQRLFSCRLPSRVSWIPKEVSIAFGRCSASSLLLPVERSIPQVPPPTSVPSSPSSSSSPSSGWQHQFVICVEQLFGSFPAEVIAEWIEAYRIFGVTLFNLYNGNITDPDTIRIIKYYASQGLVDWRHLPPSVDDFSEEGVRLSSPASLNDCMMRHVNTSRFVVVVDIDEIIVPRLHANYSAMLTHVDRSIGLQTSYHTYSFRNAYFFRHFPEDTTQPQFLRTMRLRYRAPPSEYLFHTKSFIDPRQCLSVYNHYCWIRFPEDRLAGKQSLGISVDVDPTVALSHHYRYMCSDSSEMCSMYDRTKTVDDIMLGYRDVLTSRVQQALKASEL